eukprot:TRINITY_DN46847_c0_g1_i1.p1 TRINITY_DN46847_c0_g1~~TRINITY_DN46847_c0_g1_i1.p1  ORF type:complete len:247 (-),score=41.59 TRINITY_DN46847_c0_g1_i1:48-788(-)
MGGLFSKPWATIDIEGWSQSEKEKLKQDIKDVKWAGYKNVLLIGQISAGKSSFLNTLESPIRNYVTSTASSGSSGKSLTSEMREYIVKDEKNEAIPIRFLDSQGLEATDKGLKMEDVIQILDGNDSVDKKIHCVCFVVNCANFKGMDEALFEKWNKIREESEKRNMEPLIILTNVDEVCEQTKQNPSLVFYSEIIHAKVTEVKNKLRLNARVVLPVVNYTEQRSLVLEIDILALYALREICRKCNT